MTPKRPQNYDITFHRDFTRIFRVSGKTREEAMARAIKEEGEDADPANETCQEWIEGCKGERIELK
jgi:hypothetical protein